MKYHAEGPMHDGKVVIKLEVCLDTEGEWEEMGGEEKQEERGCGGRSGNQDSHIRTSTQNHRI